MNFEVKSNYKLMEMSKQADILFQVIYRLFQI